MKKDKKVRVRHSRNFADIVRSLQIKHFMALPKQKPFNYKQWQIDVWTEKNLRDIGRTAMVHLLHNNSALELH